MINDVRMVLRSGRAAFAQVTMDPKNSQKRRMAEAAYRAECSDIWGALHGIRIEVSRQWQPLETRQLWQQFSMSRFTRTVAIPSGWGPAEPRTNRLIYKACREELAVLSNNVFLALLRRRDLALAHDLGGISTAIWLTYFLGSQAAGQRLIKRQAEGHSHGV